jgi:hypothetical protein
MTARSIGGNAIESKKGLFYEPIQKTTKNNINVGKELARFDA